MRIFVFGITCTMMFSFVRSGGAQDTASTQSTQPAKLSVGDKAPEFTADYPAAQGGQPGQQISLQDFRGKKNVVLAFFPKAFTSGCTTQLCGYRDDWSMFEENETTVIAISADPQPREDEFRKTHNLPMIVLGDPERELIRKYGVPMKAPANNAQRSVILIDKNGVVQYVNYAYKVQTDKDALYEKIKELKE